jgi:hypothetical protein
MIMSICKRTLAVSLASAVTVFILPGAPDLASAQEAASMSCSQLWYARNTIYARNGYCFKTERARAAFGPGCFPPYGELHGWEHERVNELQVWEARKGC